MNIQFYLDYKAKISREKCIREQRPQSKLPSLALIDPEALSGWIQRNLDYTGDGPRWAWWAAGAKWIGIGWPDEYTHPNVVVYAALNGQGDQIECDCDDYALVAYQGLKEMQDKGLALPISGTQILTLISGALQFTTSFPFVYWPSHVVATFWRQDLNTKQYRLGVIDTNGLSWHDSYDAMLKYFGELYRTTYTCILTEFPFSEGV